MSLAARVGQLDGATIFVASIQTATDSPAQYIFRAGLVSGLVGLVSLARQCPLGTSVESLLSLFSRGYLGPTSDLPTILQEFSRCAILSANPWGFR